VGDHDLLVFGNNDIQLNGCHAELKGSNESGNRVFRFESTRTAMALDIEFWHILPSNSAGDKKSR
jgi:hypothetical protein